MSESPTQPSVSVALTQKLRTLAESAARVGGEIARTSFGDTLSVSLKSDRSEVTEIDLRAERAIVAHLREQRPNDAFIGEEAMEAWKTGGEPKSSPAQATPSGATGSLSASVDRVSEQTESRVHWIIDPIDGTRNFIRRTPLFACSVAAMVSGTPVAGAIYDPMRDVMYAADAHSGTAVNGVQLDVDPAEMPGYHDRGGKLVVAIPSARHKLHQELVHAILDTHVVRNLGCSTLHLAYVATGYFDATLMNTCKLWDIAAGWAILHAAGATITRPTGEPLFPLDVESYHGEALPTLAAYPRAYDRLRDLTTA